MLTSAFSRASRSYVSHAGSLEVLAWSDGGPDAADGGGQPAVAADGDDGAAVASARCGAAIGFVIFFMRRWMFVFRRRDDDDAPPSSSSSSSVAVAAAAATGTSPNAGACRLQYPSHPSAARDAQYRRRRGMYFAHPPATRASAATDASDAFSRRYAASHLGSDAMIARQLFAPCFSSYASSNRFRTSRSSSSESLCVTVAVPSVFLRPTVNCGVCRRYPAGGGSNARTCCVANKQLLVNGVPVTLKGVNRHEHDPLRGKCVDEASMRRDALMIKASNFNAVRAAHYPQTPRWYEICDEVGLYVVDEANIETHGMVCAGLPQPHSRLHLNASPSWRAAMLARVTRMVECNKNHACIFLWSLGNEAGMGPTFDLIGNLISLLRGVVGR